MTREMRERLTELRELIWMEDIPSPTIREYEEHHESIQKILKAVDTLLDADIEVELSEVSTNALFQELKKREGVEVIAEVAPHEEMHPSELGNSWWEGPCTVLRVYD